MKIAKQTQDEMILKDSGWWRLAFGIGFMFFGILFGYFMFMSGTNNGVPYIVPAIPFIFGLLWTLYFPAYVIFFDKTSGQITYTKKRTVGDKVSNYIFADVVRVETRKNWEIAPVQNQRNNQGFSTIGSAGIPRKQFELISQSVLIFKDGKEIPLDNAGGGTARMNTMRSSDTMTEREASTAKQVADFIGVPFQEIQPPQMSNTPTFGQTGAIQN